MSTTEEPIDQNPVSDKNVDPSITVDKEEDVDHDETRGVDEEEAIADIVNTSKSNDQDTELEKSKKINQDEDGTAVPATSSSESSTGLITDEHQNGTAHEGADGGDTSGNHKGGGKKGKRSKRLKEDDGIHRVTLTVTIAKAIPSGMYILPLSFVV